MIRIAGRATLDEPVDSAGAPGAAGHRRRDQLPCAPLRGRPSSKSFILDSFPTNTFGSPDLAAQMNFNPLLIDRTQECEAVYSTAACAFVHCVARPVILHSPRYQDPKRNHKNS